MCGAGWLLREGICRPVPELTLGVVLGGAKPLPEPRPRAGRGCSVLTSAGLQLAGQHLANLTHPGRFNFSCWCLCARRKPGDKYGRSLKELMMGAQAGEEEQVVTDALALGRLNGHPSMGGPVAAAIYPCWGLTHWKPWAQTTL